MNTGYLLQYGITNYGYYNTPAKPNMHARIKTMQKQTSTKYIAQFREEARQQENCKKLEGERPTGGKTAKKE